MNFSVFLLVWLILVETTYLNKSSLGSEILECTKFVRLKYLRTTRVEKGYEF